MKQLIWIAVIFLPSVTIAKKQECPAPVPSNLTIYQAIGYLAGRELKFSSEIAKLVFNEDPKENFFISTIGIYNALYLAYFLANGPLFTALQQLLGFDRPKQELLLIYKAIRDYQIGYSAAQPSVVFDLVNRFFVASENPITEYVRCNFRGELTSTNFAQSPVDTINNFVAEMTNNHITHYLSASFEPQTKLALVNAAYFKGSWKNKFKLTNTTKDKFYLSKDNVVEITMMKQKSKFRYMRLQGGSKAVELPYNDTSFSMYLLLPPRDIYDLTNLVNSFSPQLFGLIAQNSTEQEVAIALPKFTIESQLNLEKVLGKMGVGDLFTEKGDFSVLTGKNDIHFTKGIHKSKLTVEENGATASAVTALMKPRASSKTARFICNRPFIYYIYHNLSNTVLFIGAYNKPPK